MSDSGTDPTDWPYPPGSTEFEAVLGEETARLIANAYAKEPESHVKAWSDMTKDERRDAVKAVLVVRFALAQAWPRAVARTRRPLG